MNTCAACETPDTCKPHTIAQENNLTQSMQALQAETNLAMNTVCASSSSSRATAAGVTPGIAGLRVLLQVDDLETFAADIQHGRWDAVLPQVSMLQLPLGKLVDLYEQVVIEMVELREFELARDVSCSPSPPCCRGHAR